MFYIRDKKIVNKKSVLDSWKKTLFLKKPQASKLKGWILDIMNCIDKLNKKAFSLQEIYRFEKDLALKYPDNKHIKDKIRQQLQFLRNEGFLGFRGKGKYRLI
ncbi:MAG: Dam-replacing domain protein [Candidatus Omnitrophota bacterium]